MYNTIVRPKQGATTEAGTYQYEFGKGDAAIILAEMLHTNYPKHHRHVASKLQEFSELLSHINRSKLSGRERQGLYLALRDYFVNAAFNRTLASVPKEVISFTKNVLNERLMSWVNNT